MEENKHNSKIPVAGSNDPFAVPEGYFDRLPDAVMQKIKESGNKEAYKKTGNKKNRIIYLSLLAAAACSIIAFILINTLPGEAKEHQYLTEAILDMNNLDNSLIYEEIITNANNEDITIIESTIYEDITSDDLIEYIIDKEINVEELYYY